MGAAEQNREKMRHHPAWQRTKNKKKKYSEKFSFVTLQWCVNYCSSNIELAEECYTGWFAQSGKEEYALDGLLKRRCMVLPSTALLCSLQKIHKAELEGQYLTALRYLFPSLLPWKQKYIWVQNNLTQLTSSFLDFFSEKVNVRRSDRLLWNLLAKSKTALKNIIVPSPLQICLQWWITFESMKTIQSRVQRTSVCNFSIWYTITT